MLTNTTARDIALVNILLKEKQETQWLEFKHNYADPDMIGKLCSALSNAGRLHHRDKGYCLWGIEDKSGRIIGTEFNPLGAKKVGQSLEIWLKNSIGPDSISVEFRQVPHPDGRVVLMEVMPATRTFTTFNRTAYIKIGDATTLLAKHADIQEKLIRLFNSFRWEEEVAEQFVEGEKALELLDYEKYFALNSTPIPQNLEEILNVLQRDNLIKKDDTGRWNITNMGAILFANNLRDFGGAIARKGIRFSHYKGGDRTDDNVISKDGSKGYAVGVEALIDFVMQSIPVSEHIDGILREDKPLFPQLAVRELIVNALIHQDFMITGTGPLIELFDDRLEIYNPGKPLIEADRMIDLPPQSRNESLAALMRRMGFCEEKGTGIDKVIGQVELYQSPPPLFKVSDLGLQTTLYGRREFSQMTEDQRLRACYFHAVHKYLGGEKMTNSSFRQRLGFKGVKQTVATVHTSNIIKKAQDRGFIVTADHAHPRSGYIPIWAGAKTNGN